MKGHGKTFGPGETKLRRIVAKLPDGTIKEWQAKWCEAAGTTITTTSFFAALRRIGVPHRERRGRHANGHKSITYGAGLLAFRAVLEAMPDATLETMADAIAARVGHRFSLNTIADGIRRERPNAPRRYKRIIVQTDVLREIASLMPADVADRVIASEYRRRTRTTPSDSTIYFALRREGLRKAAPGTRERLRLETRRTRRM